MSIKALRNEKDLLQRIADGDETSFADVFRAYYEPLFKYVFTMVESVEMSEEIVQDVFVKVWENRVVLPQLDRFVSYLFILTRNYTLDSIRKNISRKKQEQLYAEDASRGEHVEDEFKNDGASQDLLRRAVLQLPPSQQKVLLLRQQGLKTREIAEKMGISTDSVKKYQQWAASSVAKFIKANITLATILAIIRS